MILIITLGAIAGGLIRISFFPNIASDRIEVTLRMPQGTSEHITDSIISQIEDAAWQVNNNFTKRQTGNQEVIENIIKKIGPGTSNASLTINLLPGESRDFPSFVIASALDEEVGELYGIESVEYGSGSNFGGKPISVSIMGNNIEELKGAKELLKKAYSENPQLKDISDNDPAGIKEIELKLKDNAYAMGFNFNDVISQVRSGFFGNQVQRFQRGRDEIKVWVRYDRVERSSIQNLDQMRIVSPSGQRVPLAEIADYKIERGEISINHLDGKREINVQADLKNPKTSATDIMAEMQEDLLPVIQAQFPSVTASFEGQNREATKVTSSAKKVLPIALFMIYVLIAFTFRTFSQPLMLLLMIPFSLIAVAWGHFIHDLSISIPSFLGIIALLGIVVNDGLVLIGKFNTYLKQGMNFDDALIAAGKSRFRAIFLTSLTTVAGLSPLILEKSRQAQFLIPMAISISYGIMLATLLTLLMLPLLLSIGNKFKVYTTWLKTGKKPTDEEVERAIIEQKVEEETYEIA
jgi:multidrug efflux pump subunit AcrB